MSCPSKRPQTTVTTIQGFLHQNCHRTDAEKETVANSYSLNSTYITKCTNTLDAPWSEAHSNQHQNYPRCHSICSMRKSSNTILNSQVLWCAPNLLPFYIVNIRTYQNTPFAHHYNLHHSHINCRGHPP